VNTLKVGELKKRKGCLLVARLVEIKAATMSLRMRNHVIKWKGAAAFALIAAFTLIGCSENNQKVKIGDALVDMSDMAGDRRSFKAASDRWHASNRSSSDSETMAALAIIESVAKKNFRKPLNLVGSHYATMALNAPMGSNESKVNYTWSRASFIRAAMLGDHYSMCTLSVSYANDGDIKEFESAVWAFVALEFGTGDDVNLGGLVAHALGRLTPEMKDAARRRADSLITEIRKNKATYEQLVGTDF
jgi:hypothetical protein